MRHWESTRPFVFWQRKGYQISHELLLRRISRDSTQMAIRMTVICVRYPLDLVDRAQRANRKVARMLLIVASSKKVDIAPANPLVRRPYTYASREVPIGTLRARFR